MKKLQLLVQEVKWVNGLQNIFQVKDFEVTGMIQKIKFAGKDIIVSESLVGAILKADYVVLCTPTRRTPEIIRLIAKEMKRGTYLIEISSEKSKVVSSLSKMPDKNQSNLHSSNVWSRN